MARTAKRRTLRALATIAVGGLILASGSAAASSRRSLFQQPASHQIPSTARLFVPAPDAGAVRQIRHLVKTWEFRDAALLGRMVTTPQAVWFTSGTPEQVRSSVRQTVVEAARQHTVPVLVAYNVPFRDCAQYSSGGAVDTAAYRAWIDGFASGLGGERSIVLLEPDSLGIIPFNTDVNGNAEWCKPTDAAGRPQPGATPQDRYTALNAAVDRLERQPNTSVYLDGTNSGWLTPGDAADRLAKAGVQRAQGFFLNVSNYQSTPRLQKYGTWISSCLAFANNPADGGWRLGHYSYCASQYYPATATDFSTWGLSDKWYTDNLGTAVPTTHFVADTSRNGQGAADMSGYGRAPYNQSASVVASLTANNWCNPPGAGTGLPPTVRTGVPLLDAYLWVKIPGESDGACDIAGGARAWDYAAYNPWKLTGDAQLHFDPLWGMVDPAAGDWFPEQSLQLAQRANPPLLPR